MFRAQRLCLAAIVVAVTCRPAIAQAPAAAPAAAAPQPAVAVAATVNGQPIYEAAVQRALERVPAAKRDEARAELLNFFVDNVLIEQYLVQLKVVVAPADVEKKLEEMRTELKKRGQDFGKMLTEMRVSEAELREHISADLRWDRFVAERATDAVLKQQFDGQKEMFDGSVVRARHILLTPGADPMAAEAARQQLVQVKQQIEGQVAAKLAALPASSDALARDKARAQIIDEAFAAAAKEKSTCPSKSQGGDVGWFQRSGIMVEPFARAAFAMKPYTLSEVVPTRFGMHLILVTDRKAGQEVKFEEVKDSVREHVSERLREAVVAQMRPRSQVQFTPVATAKP